MNNTFDQNMSMYDGEHGPRRHLLMIEIDGLTWKDNLEVIKQRLKKLGKSPWFIRQYSLVMAYSQLPWCENIKKGLRNRWISVSDAEKELRGRVCRGRNVITREAWDWFYGRNEAGEIVSNG